MNYPAPPPPQQMTVVNVPITPKARTTAILLAVIFGGFGLWIYTYKVDAWKFWLNFVMSIFTLSLWAIFVAWPWSIIDALRRTEAWYNAFPVGDSQGQMGMVQQYTLAAPPQQWAPPSQQPYAAEAPPVEYQPPPMPPPPNGPFHPNSAPPESPRQ